MATVGQRLKYIVQRVVDPQLRPFLIVVSVGTVVMLGIVFIPAIYSPYVRVPSSEIAIQLGCVPNTVQVRTPTTYAKLERAKISVGTSAQQDQVYFPITAQSVTTFGEQVLVLGMPDESQKTASEIVKGINGGAAVTLNLEFAQLPFVDIVAVSLEPLADNSSSQCARSIEGRELIGRVSPGADYMWYALMHDRVSDVLRLSNQFAGNIVLAFMFVWTCWLSSLLGVNFVRATFHLDESIRETYESKRSRLPLDLKNEDAYLIVEALHEQDHRRFAFARVVGPALGFMLTVSSLVAGLHPASGQYQHETFQFVSSLQIALVATFMGLAIRIIAELALRYSNSVADRMLSLVAVRAEHA